MKQNKKYQVRQAESIEQLITEDVWRDICEAERAIEARYEAEWQRWELFFERYQEVES